MSKITSLVKSAFPRKFVYTFNPETNKYVDPRFQVKMVNRMLNTSEKNHIIDVTKSAFKLFDNNLNNKQLVQPTYITPQMFQSINQFKFNLKEQHMSLDLELSMDTEEDMISKGNLQVRGIKYPVEGLYIHQIKSARIADILYCKLRDFVDQEAETNMKEAKIEYGQRFKNADLRKSIIGDEMKNQVNKYIQYKKQTASKSFYNRFKSNLSAYSIVIDEIPLRIKYYLSENGKVKQSNQLTISTKWLHEIQENTAESIKKQPKRTLFDIEDWHRGFFIPVFDFTPHS